MQALQARLIESQIGETQAQALQRQAQTDDATPGGKRSISTNLNNGPAPPCLLRMLWLMGSRPMNCHS